jgi:hypothetical protein
VARALACRVETHLDPLAMYYEFARSAEMSLGAADTIVRATSNELLRVRLQRP